MEAEDATSKAAKAARTKAKVVKAARKARTLVRRATDGLGKK